MKKLRIGIAVGFLAFLFIMGAGSLFLLSELPADQWKAAAGDTVYQKNRWVNLYGLTQKILGKREIPDASPEYEVLRLNNGYLTFRYDVCDVKENAESTIAFQKFLEQEGIPFLYVQAPYKISETDPQLPAGITEGSNQNADRFLELLEEGGVPYLDLRREIQKQGLDHYGMFYRTDHHWTTEAAFWGFTEIYEAVCERLGLEADDRITDLENYRTEVYEGNFLGSQGRRTGIPYSGLDDMTVIRPDFSTSFQVLMPNSKRKSRKERSGSFEEVLLYRNYMEEPDIYQRSSDMVYGDNYSLQIIRNLDEEAADRKIFFLKDSFGRPSAAFLSLGFSEIHSIDLRKFDGLYEYIQQEKPDMVVVMYNPSRLRERSSYEFQE